MVAGAHVAQGDTQKGQKRQTRQKMLVVVEELVVVVEGVVGRRGEG